MALVAGRHWCLCGDPRGMLLIHPVLPGSLWPRLQVPRCSFLHPALPGQLGASLLGPLMDKEPCVSRAYTSSGCFKMHLPFHL